MDTRELIYDWNRIDAPAFSARPIELVDESLRDGIQSPSVRDPSIEDKKRFLHLLDAMGVQWVDIGLPGAGKRAQDDVLALAQEIRDARLGLRATCAARTVVADVAPVAEVQQRTGVPLKVYTFIGSSPIRQYAEDWDLDRMLRATRDAVSFARKENLEVAFVTEDTIRSHPATLDRMFRAAIDAGADTLCICDTVGHATPLGVRRLVEFTRSVVRATGADVAIDWHGHNDRGLALVNTLTALQAGARRGHGCILGVGERVGNAMLDQLLLNLQLLGAWDHDLSRLVETCEFASRAWGVPVPYNYPLVGEDAFRTATGVHAAAIIKAERKGDRWLADRIYSGVPAGDFGRRQKIEIGHYSGMSNVLYWLRSRGLPDDEKVARAILDRAKGMDRLLTDEEVLAIVRAAAPAKDAGARAAGSP